MFRKLFLIMLLALLTSACAHQAAFTSDPPGAQVMVDGKEIGVTPCSFDYQLSSGGSHDVTVAKPGFTPVHFEVKADEVDKQARNKWMAAGVVWSPLWAGTLFTKKLKDSYEFVLREDPPDMTARSTEDPMFVKQAL
jgi:hypothetical protein